MFVVSVWKNGTVFGGQSMKAFIGQWNFVNDKKNILMNNEKWTLKEVISLLLF